MAIFRYTYEEPENFNKVVMLKPGPGKFRIERVYHTDKDGFELRDAHNRQMIRLELTVKDQHGARATVLESISVSWKIKEFADSIGQPGLYNQSGEFDTDSLIGLTGACIIKLDGWTDRNGKARTSNKIESFVSAVAGQGAPMQQSTGSAGNVYPGVNQMNRQPQTARTNMAPPDDNIPF